MTGDEVQEIKNTRRILAVSLEDATQQLSQVVQGLTGSAPEATSTSLAGSSHDLTLKTAYYTAVVPIWIDLIASPTEWTSSSLSPEAKEVLEVLGGLVLVFPLTPLAHPSAKRTKDVIREVGRVVKDGLGGWEWDGVSLAVGVGEGTAATAATTVEEWDDLCAEAGLEFVQMTGSAKDEGLNEFDEKMGIARVREALEANDWASSTSPLSDFGDFEEGSEGLGADGDGDFDPENLDFGFDKADFEGMRMDILRAGLGGGDQTEEDRAGAEPAGSSDAKKKKDEEHKDDKKEKDEEEEGAELNDDDVLKVERMMRKLQAVREAGEGMGQEQRKRMAARAVEEVMREL